MLDRAIAITRHSFIVLASIYVVYVVPTVIAQFFASASVTTIWADLGRILTSGGTPDAQAMDKIMRTAMPADMWLVVLTLIGAVVSPLPTGALLWAAAKLYAGSGPVTFRDAYRAGLRSWTSLLVLNLMWLSCGGVGYVVVLLCILIVAFTAAIFAAVSQAVAIAVAVVLGVVALLAAAVVGSAVAVAVYVSYLAVIVERKGFAPAFASALSRVFAHAFRRSALTGLTLLAITIGVVLIGMFGQGVAVALLHSAPLGLGFSAIVDVLVTILIATYMVVNYYDLLVRTEGFDLRAALAAQVAVATPPAG
jgi:hypothetical protein